MLFFQLMTRRYEHASTVTRALKSGAPWFGDEVMAAALIDCLVHCNIVTIRGNSYRSATTRALAGAEHHSGPGRCPATPTPAPPGRRDELRLVPSLIRQIFNRRKYPA
jgi:hypothetical protein